MVEPGPEGERDALENRVAEDLAEPSGTVEGEATEGGETQEQTVEVEQETAEEASPKPLWRAHGASAIGASHVRSGAPNQDRVSVFPEEPAPYVVASVSDGHGSVKYVRSHLGAQFATETILGLFHEMEAHDVLDQLNSPTLRELLHDRYGRDVAEDWVARVDAHRKANPLLEEETRLLTEKGGEGAVASVVDEEGHPRITVYGATLLAVVVTPTVLFVAQIGDGDIVLVDAEGQAKFAVAKEPGMLGNETTSLCTKDAASHFQLEFVNLDRNRPEMIMLSTDGYANSFSDDESFLQVATDLYGMVKKGSWEKIRANLKDWLSETSAAGSGDDISAVLLIPDTRVETSFEPTDDEK